MPMLFTKFTCVGIFVVLLKKIVAKNILEY